MEVNPRPYTGPRKAAIGQAQLWEIEEIAELRPLSAMTADQALVASLPRWMFPTYVDAEMQFDIVTRSWILIHEGRVIVIDPCTGNGRDFPDHPPAHMLDTPYIERFEATGIRVTDVDFVFCTHLHMDHCGWNTTLRGGRFVPTFPNAQYILMRQEMDRWDPRRPGHVPVPQNAGTFENSVLPVLEAGLARIVDGHHTICTGVEIEPSFGHTIGHSSLHLSSGGQQAYFVGDVFHHPLEMVAPGLDDCTSENFALLRETRQRLIDIAVRDRALIVPAHFRCPFGGHLHSNDDGLVFEPYAWQPESAIPG